MVTDLSLDLSETDIETVWDWVNEFPENNRDDFGPQTLEDFKSFVLNKMKLGVIMLAVRDKTNTLIGVIGLNKINPVSWETAGIIFGKRWHGTGAALNAMWRVLKTLRASGVQKVSAKFFRDNKKIRKFLYELGFRPEGILKNQTLQHGKPIDVCVWAVFLNSLPAE